MLIVRGQEPWQVSTHFIISEERPQGAESTCQRYNAAYRRLWSAAGRLSPDHAMSLMDQTAQSSTMWSVGESELLWGETMVTYTRST